jgi:hypothetical protein
MSSSSIPTKPPSKRPVTMLIKNTTYIVPSSVPQKRIEDFNAMTQTVNPHLDPRNDTNGFKCVEYTRHRSQKSKVQDYSKDLSEESSHDEKDDTH